ncbi:polysaccharide pyruvyl transferase family protein [Vibrio astriarenae]|uniref:Polysaccharide pyruvyl transferase family protein n=1 Tax=Vibrio astriarenae TaxID=1481923 RepID=A0A7Z2YET4_9VIBR|nr:polysaccharide pyruvyl transferase family protein [Vibrio astriarenae]QIA64430.1 polysaccharide pyruvyl transferase family protein [Vibrio astriarenae]
MTIKENKKKVGIVTFHDAHNYGALLQAYALKHKISSLGYDVGFVDAKNEKLSGKYNIWPTIKTDRSLVVEAKKMVRLLLDFSRKKARYNGFNQFIDKYINTDIPNSLDSIVIGSDQVWNFNITGGVDPIYFGEIEGVSTKNVISYAASMGNGMKPESFTSEFRGKLENLNQVGVREKQLQESLADNFGVESVVTLDPTLLLTEEEWSEITPSSKQKKKYVVVYQVVEHPMANPIVDLIAEKLGLEVIVLTSKTDHSVSKSHFSTASPDDFLSLFKNAEFVITSSFHGTAFSIINKVPFYTMKFGNTVDLRSENLLSSANLLERHISDISEVDLDAVIDFENAEESLSKVREQSVAYLQSSLR